MIDRDIAADMEDKYGGLLMEHCHGDVEDASVRDDGKMELLIDEIDQHDENLVSKYLGVGSKERTDDGLVRVVSEEMFAPVI